MSMIDQRFNVNSNIKKNYSKIRVLKAIAKPDDSLLKKTKNE